MAGPWEDFQQPATTPPWEDFKSQPESAPSWVSTSDQAIQKFTAHVLTGFGIGAHQAFGEAPVATPATALSPETIELGQKIGAFNGSRNDALTFVRNLTETTARTVAAGAQLFVRGSAAAAGGALGAVGAAGEELGLAEPGKLTGEEGLAGAATDPGLLMLLGGGVMLPEAEAANAARIRNLQTNISRARASGAIGEGEAGFYNIAPVTPEATVARASAAKEAGVPVQEPPTPAPTVHDLARQIEPDAFQNYDQLTTLTDQLKRSIDQRLTEDPKADVGDAYRGLLDAEAKIGELGQTLRDAYNKAGGIFPPDEEALAGAFGRKGQREEDELTQIRAETQGMTGAVPKTGNGKLPNEEGTATPGPLVQQYEDNLKATGAAPLTAETQRFAFHGTTTVFEQFNRGKGIGPHFGTAEQANEFAKGEGGHIRPVILNIKNPLRTEDGFWENPPGLALQLSKQGIFDDTDLEAVLEVKDNDEKAFEVIRSALTKKGYDGIVYANKVEGRGDSYIPFNPEHQVKPRFSTTETPQYAGLEPYEGTGATRERGLATSVESRALALDLTTRFGDLPEYKQLDLDQEAAKATALMDKDWNGAVQMVMEGKQPPGKLPLSVLFRAVETRALTEGKFDVINDLAQRSKTLELATTAGQFIRGFGDRDELSPVRAIQDIAKGRQAAFKGDLDAAKTETINQIKQTMGSAASPTPIWDKFIQSILCEE